MSNDEKSKKKLLTLSDLEQIEINERLRRLHFNEEKVRKYLPPVAKLFHEGGHNKPTVGEIKHIMHTTHLHRHLDPNQLADFLRFKIGLEQERWGSELIFDISRLASFSFGIYDLKE
ncbi:MAG: hypothetical protein KF681_15820 [Bdellovibrionaceae bacterium]|nr:hypothetical protein [Pseudobdellovibrionaceae bacterium]